MFVAACKEGRKPEVQQVKSAVIAWFEWARRQRIVIAMSGEVVYTPDGEAVALAEMMRPFPVGSDAISEGDNCTVGSMAKDDVQRKSDPKVQYFSQNKRVKKFWQKWQNNQYISLELTRNF